MIMQFQAILERNGIGADRVFRIQINGFRVNIRKIVFRKFFDPAFEDTKNFIIHPVLLDLTFSAFSLP